MTIANKRSNYLVVGGDSYVGSILLSKLSISGNLVLSTTRRPINTQNKIFLDLTAKEFAGETKETIKNSEVIFFLAGITNTGVIESNPARSWNVNVNGLNGILDLIEGNTKLVYLSSTRVFDSSKSNFTVEDMPNFGSYYGREKAHCENLLLESKCNYVVVRLGKILDVNRGYISTYIDRILAGQKIYVSKKRYVSPTDVDSLTLELATKIGYMNRQIVHFFPVRALSFYELFTHIAQFLKISPELVQVQREDLDTDKYDVLINSTEFFEERDIDEILASYFRRRYS